MSNKISLQSFQVFVFGEKNKNIDKFFDFFYTLEPERKIALRLWGYGFAICIVILLLALYVGRMWILQNQMNDTVQAEQRIGDIAYTYSGLQKQFIKIKTPMLENNMSDIQTKIQNALNLFGAETSSDLSKFQLLDLSISHPLAKQFKKFTLALSFPELSLKKTLDIANALTDVCEGCRITSLNILQNGEEKVYFQVDFVLEGYMVNQNG